MPFQMSLLGTLVNTRCGMSIRLQSLLSNSRVSKSLESLSLRRSITARGSSRITTVVQPVRFRPNLRLRVGGLAARLPVCLCFSRRSCELRSKHNIPCQASIQHVVCLAVSYLLDVVGASQLVSRFREIGIFCRVSLFGKVIVGS